MEAGMRLQPKEVFVSADDREADVGIVLGAADEVERRYRVMAAVKLWKRQQVPVLLLCGDSRGKQSDGPSEAQQMKLLAMEHGVAEESLLIEDSSSELTRLAKAITKSFRGEQRLQDAQSALLISSAWHVLRVYIVMRKHLPGKIRLGRHAISEGITADNWMLSDRGRAVAENELRLLEKLTKSGYSLKW